MKIVAAKVWCPDEEGEPEGIVHPGITDSMPNWFREDPEYAAELYALEKMTPGEAVERVIRVIDTANNTSDFKVSLRYKVVATVTPMHGTTVLINMKPHLVTTPELSYEDVCMLTRGKIVDGLSVVWRQMGRKGESEKSGMLYHTGPNLKVGPNTYITAVMTNNA